MSEVTQLVSDGAEPVSTSSPGPCPGHFLLPASALLPPRDCAQQCDFFVVVVSLVFTIRLCRGFFWLLECTEQWTFLESGPCLHPVASVSNKNGISSPTVSLFQERKLNHNDSLYWAF